MSDIAEGPNAAGIRADAKRERTILAMLTSPAFLLLAALLYVPVGWLFCDWAPSRLLEKT